MRFPIFGVGLTAKSPNVSSQRRVNLYLEYRTEEDATRIVACGTPGLILFLDVGDTPPRGMLELGNSLFIIHRSTFYEVNNAGVTTNRGTLLTSSGRVHLIDNGSYIMLVDGTNGYTYNLTTHVFARIVDADYVSAATVTWLDGFFIQEKVNTSRFYISAINDPTSWDPLDFGDAESSPDNIVRVIADHGELILFGELTTEFWGDSGAADFPFARLGSSAVEWGLSARDSLAKFDSSLMFLGKNRMGESQVVLLNGYTPVPVGSYDFLTQINSYSVVNDATAFSYMLNGHPFYQINFPTANTSWLYDGSTKIWHELSSDTGRHRANMGVNFLNKTTVADYTSGKLYRLDQNTYTDNGVAIRREITSRHIRNDKYTSIGRFWLDVETGVGLATDQGSDPQIMLSVSKDGGHTWGTEHFRSLGKIGEYKKRAYWNRLGSSYNWTFKAAISDPVKVEIMNEGWID
jgi:hypothetical protein